MSVHDENPRAPGERRRVAPAHPGLTLLPPPILFNIDNTPCPVCGHPIKTAVARAFCKHCGLDIDAKHIRHRPIPQNDTITETKQHALAILIGATTELRKKIESIEYYIKQLKESP
jgi:hypothetical protein